MILLLLGCAPEAKPVTLTWYTETVYCDDETGRYEWRRPDGNIVMVGTHEDISGEHAGEVWSMGAAATDGAATWVCRADEAQVVYAIAE